MGGGRGGVERHKMKEWRLWEKEMQMRNWEREIIINKKCRKEREGESEKELKSCREKQERKWGRERKRRMRGEKE